MVVAGGRVPSATIAALLLSFIAVVAVRTTTTTTDIPTTMKSTGCAELQASQLDPVGLDGTPEQTRLLIILIRIAATPKCVVQFTTIMRKASRKPGKKRHTHTHPR